MHEQRKFLVTLPYARETLHFAITSHEASSPEEALTVARDRVEAARGGAYLDDLYLGTLVKSPTVRIDTDVSRMDAGISDEGYPPTFTDSYGEWYDYEVPSRPSTNVDELQRQAQVVRKAGTYAEAARILGMPVTTLQTRMARARSLGIPTKLAA